MRKWLIGLLFFMFLNLTVLAEGDNVGETIGYIVDIEGDVMHVVGEPLTSAGFSDVLVRVGDAPVYDLRTGFPVPHLEIVPEIGIRTAYIAADAEPFEAIAIWLNWDNDDVAVFTVVASGNIRYGAEGSVFLSADEKYRVTLTPETLIIDPEQGFLTPADILPGMEFFVWVDMITASSPAYVHPDKVVLIR